MGLLQIEAVNHVVTSKRVEKQKKRSSKLCLWLDVVMV